MLSMRDRLHDPLGSRDASGLSQLHAVDVCFGQVRMMLVGDDTTPVECGLLSEPRGGVEEEFGIDDRVATVDS